MHLLKHEDLKFMLKIENKMKPNYTFFALSAVLALASCGSDIDASKNPSTSLDSFSYSVGVDLAKNFKNQAITEIDFGSLVRGIQDGLAKDSGFVISEEKLQEVQRSYVTSIQAKRMKEIQQETKDILTAFGKESGVTQLPSKGYYKQIKAGNGPSPQSYDTIECRFIAKDGKGKVLFENTKEPMPFRGVVTSLNLLPLEEALMKTAAGGKFQVKLSNELNPVMARSSRSFDAMYGITDFELELLSVKAGLPPSPGATAQGPAQANGPQ